MLSRKLFRLSALALVALVALVPPAAATGPDDNPGPLLPDGRLIPVAPEVFARNEAGVTVRATRITTPIVIDGQLDEPLYRGVTPITQFVQQDPKQGAPVSERTESWVLYDDRNLYVVCRCLDEHPERMVANEMRRDSTNLRQNDNFAVELDTFHDKRNGFLFYRWECQPGNELFVVYTDGHDTSAPPGSPSLQNRGIDHQGQPSLPVVTAWPWPDRRALTGRPR